MKKADAITSTCNALLRGELSAIATYHQAIGKSAGNSGNRRGRGATLFGESPALTTLQRGEEPGITEFEKALADDDVDESVKELTRDELLPALRDHLFELERSKSKIV
ncbi:MAG: hypothetical protein RLZZ214_3231 [Verrucomicrobiota bacterium]|jgi:hypothetical protein